MPRAGLSRDVVVLAAADLADEVGWNSVTLAGVAARVGVRLPSLYNHVTGLDDLRSAVSTLALRELAASARTAVERADDADRLVAFADAYRSYALSSGGRYAATQRPPAEFDEAQSVAADDLLATIYTVLDGYGLRGEERLDATRALRAAMHGWADLERGHGFGIPRSVDASYRRMIDRFDAEFRGVGVPASSAAGG